MRVRGVDYERIPVKTHLIHIKEPLEPVFDEYVKPVLQPGDWLAVSEKFVTISQGRVIHHSVVRPGLLAKLLVKGVTKHPDDVGYSDPRKMQVAIMQAGLVSHAVRDDRRAAHPDCSCAAAATSTASPVTASPRSTASAPRR